MHSESLRADSSTESWGGGGGGGGGGRGGGGEGEREGECYPRKNFRHTHTYLGLEAADCAVAARCLKEKALFLQLQLGDGQSEPDQLRPLLLRSLFQKVLLLRVTGELRVKGLDVRLKLLQLLAAALLEQRVLVGIGVELVPCPLEVRGQLYDLSCSGGVCARARVYVWSVVCELLVVNCTVYNTSCGLSQTFLA